MATMTFTEAVHATIKAEAAARGVDLRQLSLDSGLGREALRGLIYKKRPLNTDVIASVAEKGLNIDVADFVDQVKRRMNQ